MKKSIPIFSLFALGALALFGATTFFAAAAEADDTTQQGMRRGGEERMMQRGMHGDQHLEEVATILEVSVDEIRSALDEGQRLPDIIEAYGMDQETFQAAMHTTHLERLRSVLDEKVASGDLTQEEADARYEQAASFEGPFDGHFGKHRGEGMFGDGNCQQETAVATE